MSRLFLSTRRTVMAVALCAPLPAMAQAVDYAELGAMMGEPVTTSVTGKPQRASEAPAAITIITREQIARSPARDVPSLLKSYAGVDVNSWTAGQSDVAVRGGVQVYNPRLLVMVNGRQVYLDHYGLTNWNLLGVQLEEIQQIELVRGPASALFGFNAASGVVNIITVDAMSNRLGATAEIGNHGISRLSAVAGLALGDNAGFRVSGGRSREHQRAVPNTLFDPQNDSPVEHGELSGTFTATPGDGNHLSVNAGYARSRELQYLSGPIVGEVRIKTRTLGTSLSHDTGWGSLDGRGYVNWMDYRNPDATAAPGGRRYEAVRFKNRVAVGQASVLARIGPITTLRVSGEYRANRLRSDKTLYSPEISYAVVAGSAMIDIRPSDRVALTAAVRIDRMSLKQSGAPNQPIVTAPSAFDRRLTAFSFNAAALVKVGANGQLRINGGRGIQAPSLLSLGVHLPLTVPGVPFPVVISGDPALIPPQVWSGEIGYAQPLGEHFTVDANVHVLKTDEFIGFLNKVPVFGIGPAGQLALVGRSENIGDLFTYGAELSLSADFGRWTGRMNYSWSRTDDDKLQADHITAHQLNPKQATPHHKVNTELGYDAGRWFGTVTGRYTSSTRQLAITPLDIFEQVRIPTTLALDAKLGWRILPNVTLIVAGENLTKARGAAGSPIWADRRIRAGAGLAL